MHLVKVVSFLLNNILSLNTFTLLTIPGFIWHFMWHFINCVFLADYTVNGSLPPSRSRDRGSPGNKGREPRGTR